MVNMEDERWILSRNGGKYMADKWINTVEYGYFIDANSEVGYSYMGADRVQCPHCKKKYPTVNYIVEANYCPNCGGKVNNKNQDGID